MKEPTPDDIHPPDTKVIHHTNIGFERRQPSQFPKLDVIPSRNLVEEFDKFFATGCYLVNVNALPTGDDTEARLGPVWSQAESTRCSATRSSVET
jgi:hypothetical protein